MGDRAKAWLKYFESKALMYLCYFLLTLSFLIPQQGYQ